MHYIFLFSFQGPEFPGCIGPHWGSKKHFTRGDIKYHGTNCHGYKKSSFLRQSNNRYEESIGVCNSSL